MTDTPPDQPVPAAPGPLAHADPNNLPAAPTRNCPVSAACFDRLLAAARKGGWPAVFTAFAEGETVPEIYPSGRTAERPARRRTLGEFLNKRPDLRMLLDSAAQERKDKLISSLQDEVEKIALGPGDITKDFGKDGRLTRTRVDTRQKLYAALSLLKAHDPDTYADRRKLDIAGQVTHDHTHAQANGYLIPTEAALRLPPADQELLFGLLEKLQRLESAPRRELIDHNPEDPNDAQ